MVLNVNTVSRLQVLQGMFDMPPTFQNIKACSFYLTNLKFLDKCFKWHPLFWMQMCIRFTVTIIANINTRAWLLSFEVKNIYRKIGNILKFEFLCSVVQVSDSQTLVNTARLNSFSQNQAKRTNFCIYGKKNHLERLLKIKVNILTWFGDNEIQFKFPNWHYTDNWNLMCSEFRIPNLVYPI